MARKSTSIYVATGQLAVRPRPVLRVDEISAVERSEKPAVNWREIGSGYEERGIIGKSGWNGLNAVMVEDPCKLHTHSSHIHVR